MTIDERKFEWQWREDHPPLNEIIRRQREVMKEKNCIAIIDLISEMLSVLDIIYQWKDLKSSRLFVAWICSKIKNLKGMIDENAEDFLQAYTKIFGPIERK